MTTAEPDRPLTAADLLFGSSADVPEALARQIVSVGRGQNLGRVLTHLPRVTQEAAIREAALAAAVLLKVDLIDVLVAGWRDHRDIHSAARRSAAFLKKDRRACGAHGACGKGVAGTGRAFPGVDLLDGQSAATEVPGSEHPSGQLPGPDHPSSGEADHRFGAVVGEDQLDPTRREVFMIVAGGLNVRPAGPCRIRRRAPRPGPGPGAAVSPGCGSRAS